MFPPISRWQHLKQQPNQTNYILQFQTQTQTLCFSQLFATGLSNNKHIDNYFS